MGPLITREHRDRVASYLDIAKSEGATVTVDGRDILVSAERASSSALRCSIPLNRVCAAMKTKSSALFWALFARRLIRSGKLINRNQYGNGAAIFTRDGGAARQFQFDVEVEW